MLHLDKFTLRFNLPVSAALFMLQLLAAFAVVLVTTAAVASTSTSVELDYRLRPDRDITADMTTEAITTMHVIEDRGIVAKSNGRLSSSPTTIQIIRRQAFRYITGPELADESFSAEMRYLKTRTFLRSLDGQEQALPDKMPLEGLVVRAMIERDGSVRNGSVVLSGLDASAIELFRTTIESVMLQAASIKPIRISIENGASQSLSMNVPIPGASAIDVGIHIHSRLIDVDNGIAKVEQIYTMDFGVPSGPIKMTAEGSGGGTLMYDVASSMLITNRSSSLMKFSLDTPEGVLGISMSSKDSQSMRQTPLSLR